MDKQVTVVVPDFSIYFVDWGFWNWVLAYCCVLWFLGFFYSLYHVKKCVKLGKISNNRRYDKAEEGLLAWVFFPILAPIFIICYIAWTIFNSISYMYDFKK